MKLLRRSGIAGILMCLCFIVLFGCNRQQTTAGQAGEHRGSPTYVRRDDDYLVIRANPRYDWRAFSVNPMSGSSFIPPVVADDWHEMTGGVVEPGEVHTRQTPDPNSPSGYSEQTVIEGEGYEATYNRISVGDGKWRYLRRQLLVRDDGIEMKYGIRIGLEIEDLLVRIDERRLSKEAYTKQRYYVDVDDEVTLLFKAEGSKLASLSVLIGD